MTEHERILVFAKTSIFVFAKTSVFHELGTNLSLCILSLSKFMHMKLDYVLCLPATQWQ